MPRLGRVGAAPGFRMVAAMNPYDAVGTARISGAVYDRVCRVSMGYQSLDDELAIVVHEAKSAGATEAVGDEDFVRPGRQRGARHPRAPRRAHRLLGARRHRHGAASPTSSPGCATPSVTEDGTALDAACMALSGRIRVHESCHRSPEEIVAELWDLYATTIDLGDGVRRRRGPGKRLSLPDTRREGPGPGAHPRRGRDAGGAEGVLPAHDVPA